MPLIKDNSLVNLEYVISDLEKVLAMHGTSTTLILSTSECVQYGDCVNDPTELSSALRIDHESLNRFVQFTWEDTGPTTGQYILWCIDELQLRKDGIEPIAEKAWLNPEINKRYSFKTPLTEEAARIIFSFMTTGKVLIWR